MKIYVAHPISGENGATIVDYYSNVRTILGPYYEVLSPMTGKGYLRTDPKLKADGCFKPISTNHAIFERDMWMVSQADVVLVDLWEAEQVSIGCMMEMAVAAWLRKHVVLIMDAGSMHKDNVHRHAFVLEAADIIFDNKTDAFNYLIELAHEEPKDVPESYRVRS